MAWRSSGTTNDEMVNNLKRFGVISTIAVENGFRHVDRKFFVPQNRIDVAHSDQPLKEGNVHISAPHIYGNVLEALELHPNSALSFLNAGSGTGYLSCIAASILGPRSSHYCVEIHEDVAQHCKESIERWKDHHAPARAIRHMDIIHGNALQIAADEGEASLGFDRIYVGAAVDGVALSRLKKLLKPGGILVGPVDDELIKVVRMHHHASSSSSSPLSSSDASQQFSQQVLSGVRFAPLIHRPLLRTVIPSRVWSPAVHQYYPDSFQKSCKELLLCSHADYVQPVPPRPSKSVNLASLLPTGVWIEIISYTHRDWFEAPQSEVDVLKRRLEEEQANSERAQKAREEAEARCAVAERERDIYRLLARRWQSRLNAVLNQHGEDPLSEGENLEDAASAAVLLHGREQLAIFGFGDMFRHVRAQMGAALGSDEEEDDDDGHDVEDIMERNSIVGMEEDEEDLHNEEMVDEDDDDDESLSTSSHLEASSPTESSPIGMNVSPSTAKAMAQRPQGKTVSIQEADEYFKGRSLSVAGRTA